MIDNYKIDLFNQMDIDNLVKALDSKRAVLFIGAGFSESSKNILDSKLPRASELANEIGKLGNFDDENDLQYSAERYLRENDSENLINLLQNLYTVKECSNESKSILGLEYRRIYTTNYDDLISKASNHNGMYRKILTVKDNPQEYYKTTNNCIHINGHIQNLSENTLNNSFKLTEASYLKNSDSFLDSKWASPFKKDLESATAIIFLGYSLEYDIDIKKILFEDSVLKEKTYFITRKNPSERKQSNYIKFGKILDIEIEGFSEIIKQNVNQKNVEIEFKVFEEIEYNLNLENQQVTDDEIKDLLTRGKIVNDKLDMSPYIIERSNHIENIENLLHDNNRLITVISEFGNGKTIFKEKLKYHLISKGYRVFELKDYELDFQDDIETIIKIPNSIIIIDSYTNRLDLIKYYLMLSPKKTPIIMLDRTSSNTYTKRSIEEFNPYEIILDKLTDNEINDFIDLLTHIGAWGNLSGEKKVIHEKFKDSYNSQISLMLLDMFESEPIKASIKSLIQPVLKNNESKKTILSIFLLSLMNLPFSRTLIEEMSSSKIIHKKEIMESDTYKNFFLITDNYQIILKSTLLARFVVKNYFTNIYLKNFFVELSIKANKKKINDEHWETIQRELFRFHFLEQLVSDDGKKEFLYNYFEFLKKDPELRWLEGEPHYWLQYGMANIAMANIKKDSYEEAQLKLTNAYKYAQNKKNDFYLVDAIDNQQARLYILQACQNDKRGDESFNLFEKANNLLPLTINENENLNYNAKQVSEFKKIYNTKFKYFPVKDKESFIQIIFQKHKDLIRLEDEIPSIFYSSYELYNCIKNLETILTSESQLFESFQNSKSLIKKSNRNNKVLSKIVKTEQIDTSNEQMSIKEIAKQANLTIDELISFALNSNIPLPKSKLTTDGILNKQQALGIINKIKNGKVSKMQKTKQIDTSNEQMSIKEIAKQANLTIDELISFALNSNIPLPKSKLTTDGILNKQQALGIINKIKNDNKS